jgi:hypothetical protein
MLEMLMFWKKKKDPKAWSVQQLANLLGSSTVDFPAQTILEETSQIDLQAELFVKNNLAIAKLVVIAGLLKNDKRQRRIILNSVDIECLGKNAFEGYIFRQVRESLAFSGKISPSKITEQIYQYSPKVAGKANPSRSLDEYFFRWSLILGFGPTPAQVDQAIKIISTECTKEDQD